MTIRRSSLRSYVWLFLLLVGCGHSTDRETGNSAVSKESTITVAAAANLRDVLQDLKKSYLEVNPNHNIDITFGSSTLLFQQIMNGASFDLFLSADTLLPRRLFEIGKTPEQPKIYIYGEVVMWSSKVELPQSLTSLLDPNIKKIAIANPRLAPYGLETVRLLKAAKLYDRIESKIVWAENINQSAHFALSGNADVGFVAKSNAYTAEMKDKGVSYELSAVGGHAIPQAGIVLEGNEVSFATEFFEFLASQEVEKIWRCYGYVMPAN